MVSLSGSTRGCLVNSLVIFQALLVCILVGIYLLENIEIGVDRGKADTTDLSFSLKVTYCQLFSILFCRGVNVLNNKSELEKVLAKQRRASEQREESEQEVEDEFHKIITERAKRLEQVWMLVISYHMSNSNNICSYQRKNPQRKLLSPNQT